MTGTIKQQELKKALEKCSIEISDQDLHQIIKTVQLRNVPEENNDILYSEFLVATIDQKKILSKEKLIAAFKYFDINNNGYINGKNVKAAMARSGKKLPEQEIDEMIKEISTEGRINFETFSEKMVTDLTEQDSSGSGPKEHKKSEEMKNSSDKKTPIKKDITLEANSSTPKTGKSLPFTDNKLIRIKTSKQ